MAKRGLQKTKIPQALSCALIEDNGRYLFLQSVDTAGKVRNELPSCLVFDGEDPVSSIKQAVMRLCKIDAQVHHVIIKGEYNAGSKKRKIMVPALGFRLSAKSMSAKISPPYTGFRWMDAKEALGSLLERKSLWLNFAKRLD